MAGDSLNLIGRQLMNSRDLPVPTCLVLRQALTATMSVFKKNVGSRDQILMLHDQNCTQNCVGG